MRLMAFKVDLERALHDLVVLCLRAFSGGLLGDVVRDELEVLLAVLLQVRW